MSNQKIRMIILLGAMVIVGIFTIQMYWIQKAFSQENKQFEQSVHIGLSHVSKELQNSAHADAYASNSTCAAEDPFQSIEAVASNYYILHVNGDIDTNLLSGLLKKEFKHFQKNTNVEYAVYDSSTHKLVFGDFVNTSDANDEGTNGLLHQQLVEPLIGTSGHLRQQAIAPLKKGEYYIGVSFPGMLYRITGEMYLWIFSTAVLLVFVVFFAFSIAAILKQKRLSEIQKDFVNNMTHEFKTPISSIALAAETLKSYTGSQDAQLSSFVELIQLEASKLNSQVDKILLAGKSTSTSLNLKKENLDLHELIQETAEHIRATSKKKIQLSYVLLASNPVALADRLYVVHALQNLIDNAVKYSGEIADVTIQTENKEGLLWLSVADKGIGIERQYRRKIFDPFFRIPTGNLHNVRGFGIGLHYVKNIVRAHRWKLSLASEENKGSVFTLQIPL